MFDNRLTTRPVTVLLDGMAVHPPDLEDVCGEVFAATYLELYETAFVMRLLELCAELDDADAF
jgi:hypothetical protein